MPDFKAKIHHIQFRLGLRPTPLWELTVVPPDLLAGFNGATSKGRRKMGEWEGRGKRREPPRVGSHPCPKS